MEFEGNEMTVLLDVIRTLVGNSKLLGFPFQETVKIHETRVVMESRAPKWRAGPRNLPHKLSSFATPGTNIFLFPATSRMKRFTKHPESMTGCRTF